MVDRNMAIDQAFTVCKTEEEPADQHRTPGSSCRLSQHLPDLINQLTPTADCHL
jgi:hypothetical protein